MIHRPVHVAGGNGDVSVGATAGGLGTLHGVEGLYRGVAHLIGEAEHIAQVRASRSASASLPQLTPT